MKFGMPMWYGDEPLERKFKKVATLGFDYVELSLDYPLHPSKKLNTLLLKLKNKYKLGLAFHLPIPEFDLCHPSQEFSQPALNTCKKFLSLLLPLDPIYINLHLTSRIITVGFKEVWQQVVKRAEEVAIALKNFSINHNLLLTFENGTYHSIGKNPDELNFFLKKNLNLCLDIGHLAVLTFKPKQEKINTKNLLKLLTKFRKIIRVVHLHDVAVMDEKEVKDHLAIGCGEIKFEKVLHFIEETNCKYLLLEFFHSLKNKKTIPVKMKDIKNSLKFVRERLL